MWLNDRMTTQSFLAHWHAQVSVGLEAVLLLVARATGTQPADVTQIVNGYDNEVYRADLSKDHGVFVRIGRRHGKAFDKETWAMSLAREAGVPVPTVLLTTSVEDDHGGRPAMVVERAHGEVLADLLPRLSAADRYTVLADLGRVLKTLHSTKTAGVWRPDDQGTWPDPPEMRRSFIAERTAEQPHLVAAGLSSSEVDHAIALLGTSPDTPPLADFVLCHGDVTPDHIFIDSHHHVSSLIDWGMWHGGSCVGELAYVASWAYAEPDLSALLAGYGLTLDQPLREALARSLVNNLVGHVAHHVTIGDAAGTANVTKSLRRALATFQ